MGCVEAECTVNAQCNTTQLSRCDLSQTVPSCALCLSDDDCAQFTFADRCGPSGCVVGCRENEDCTDPLFPTCNLNTWQCAAVCTNDDQCAHFFERVCSADMRTCEPVLPLPSGCQEDDDCTLASQPVCVDVLGSLSCQPACSMHDQCSHFTFETFCVTDDFEGKNGTCIVPPCTRNSDCTDHALARCSIQAPQNLTNPSTPTCQMCQVHEDCSHFTHEKFCNSTGVCVTPCEEDDHCVDPKLPMCDLTTGLCSVGSTENDQCTRFYAESWCSVEAGYKLNGVSIPIGICFDPECITNFDCLNPLFPTCVPNELAKNPYCANKCVDKRMPDLHNDDCTRFEKDIWCTLRGSCEVPGCLEDSDCIDPLKPVCSLTEDPPKCVNNCTHNDQCTHFGQATVCVTDRSDPTEQFIWGTCQIPECVVREDCINPLKPVCNWLENPPICDAKCATDDDCAHFSYCQPGQDCKANSAALRRFVCITNPSPAFDSIRGICQVPECLENDDCSDPTLPVCDVAVNPPACEAACVSNDDCAHFAAEILCMGGACVKPECQNDTDCVGNPKGPACLVASRMCVPCYFDEHCTSGTNNACDTANNLCVECIQDTDCNPAGPYPACLTTRRTCVECVSDMDCAGNSKGHFCDSSRSQCVPCLIDTHCSSRACDTAVGQCVSCVTDAHCTGGSPACNTALHLCVACTSDVHCPAQTCDTSNNQCVQCVGDVDCLATGSRACLAGSHMCVQCTKDSHCSGNTPACNIQTNLCVACTKNAHCNNGMGACDVNHNVCKACVTDTDCPSGTGLPACDPVTGQCVACFSHNHCPKACDVANRVCVECAADGDCQLPGVQVDLPACDLSTHTCVACTSSDHCPNNGICNTASRTCVECLASKHCAYRKDKKSVCSTTTTPRCVECLYDGDCTDSNKPICGGGTCVGCVTSSDCWVISPTKPICSAQQTCVPCTSNVVCSGNHWMYPACDVASGACVAPSYAKGFYISAVVLGSVACFFGTIALVAVLAKLVM